MNAAAGTESYRQVENGQTSSSSLQPNLSTGPTPDSDNIASVLASTASSLAALAVEQQHKQIQNQNTQYQNRYQRNPQNPHQRQHHLVGRSPQRRLFGSICNGVRSPSPLRSSAAHGQADARSRTARNRNPDSRPDSAGTTNRSGSGSAAEYHFGRRPAIVEKRAHKFLRAMSKAMRYYRIWIYACNVALFIGALIYAGAFLTIATDSRIDFFSNHVRLWHPSFLYSYLAIFAQSGLLQIIGCIGALKLNERYLHIYLLSLFALLAGDAVCGIVWLLRYNSIVAKMPSDLLNQIQVEYANNTATQDLWNEFQANNRCCGVSGPGDWNASSWASAYNEPWDPLIEQILPPSCCHPSESTFGLPHNVCKIALNDEHVHRAGCKAAILDWLRSSVDLLSVLGFCICTFTKMCFLFLLRYEIREMIDKIRVIKGQNGNGPGGGGASASGSMGHVLPFQDLEIYLPRPSMQTEPLLGGVAPSGLGGGGSGASTTTPSAGQHTSTGQSGACQQTGAGGRSTVISSGPSERFHCRIGALAFPGHALSGSRTLMSSVSSTNLAAGDRSKKSSLV